MGRLFLGADILSRVWYTVSNNLSNCSNSSTKIIVDYETSYTATITADDGYTLDGATISITMGGVDVTSTAWVDGTITIESVTGAIVINVVAAVSVSPVYDRVFGNNTPETISNISQAIANQGLTSAQVQETYGWKLGDLVDITLKNNETIQMQIIGVNHDTLSSNHTTKAGITLQMKNCLNTKYPMNDSNTNAGGWAASKMRNSTMPTLLALLPDEWQAVIKPVDKKTANGGSSNYSATNTTSESLFLLSGVEIFGSGSSYGYAQDGANEGTQYEYWAQHNTSADRKKNFNGSASLWWERSSYYSYTSNFCAVNGDGYAYYFGASNTRGVSFAFCV